MMRAHNSWSLQLKPDLRDRVKSCISHLNYTIGYESVGLALYQESVHLKKKYPMKKSDEHNLKGIDVFEMRMLWRSHQRPIQLCYSMPINHHLVLPGWWHLLVGHLGEKQSVQESLMFLKFFTFYRKGWDLLKWISDSGLFIQGNTFEMYFTSYTNTCFKKWCILLDYTS